jgi:hypothetical protein
MDMFFLLVLFYLVLTLKGHRYMQEESALYATPNDGLGEAQVLVQAINRDSVLWLDISSFAEQDWKTGLFSENICEAPDLAEKMDAFQKRLGPCIGEEVYIAIRCPDGMYYKDVVELQELLSTVSTEIMPDRDIRYSLLNGSIEDIGRSTINIGDDEVTIRF